MTLEQRHAIRARHKEANPGPWCLPDTQYIAALEAEVERLREALGRVNADIDAMTASCNRLMESGGDNTATVALFMSLEISKTQLRVNKALKEGAEK